MSRTFFDMSGAWSKHEAMQREAGIEREGIRDANLSVQQVRSKTRVHSEASLGFDSSDVRHGDDPVVVQGQHVDGSGDITLVYHRYSQDGRFRGTYEQVWQKTAPGTHTASKSRRVYGV